MNEQWELGLWNSRNLYDPLRPKRQGFIGNTVKIGGKYWHVVNFVSGIYFPDQTIPFDEDPSGQFQSTSRWLFLPDKISILDESLDSDYWMQRPYIKNVLLRYTYLGKIFIGHPESKWISFSYANKPINQISYAVDTGLSIPENSTIQSNIRYHSQRHRLLELNIGWKINQTSIKAGLLKELLSESNPLASNWITPVIEEMVFTSLMISQSFQIGKKINNVVSISYLNPGKIKRRIVNSNTPIDFSHIIHFDRGIKMQEGFSLSWSTSWMFKNRKWINAFFTLLECH